ncbi:MAG: MFS transporter [Nitrososphaeria archaeon]
MSEERTSFSRWTFLKNPVISVLVFSNGITMLGFGQILPIIPILMYDYLHASEIEIGLTISSFAITRILSQGPIGALSDKYGRKPFITLSLLGYSVVSFLYIFASQTWHILTIRAIQGFFSGALWPVSDAMVMDICDPKHRGKVISTIQIAYNAGWFAGPFLGGVIADLYGISATFGFSAGLSFVAFITALLFLKETVKEKNVSSVKEVSIIKGFEKNFEKSFQALRKFPALKHLALSAFVLQTSLSLLQGYTPIFISDVLNGTELDIGIIIGAGGVLGLIAQFFAGSLGDRYGKWIILEVGVFIAALISPSLLLIQNLLQAYIILPIMMCCNMISSPMLTALVGDAVPSDERGAGYGAYGIVRDFSLIIGSPLGGVVLELSRNFLKTSLMQSLRLLFVFRSIMLLLTLSITLYYMKSFKEVDTIIWARSKLPPPE